MTKRRGDKNYIRNIQQSGYTYYISIPIEVMRKLKWRERQKVEVRKAGKDKIEIIDWKR